MKFAQLVRLVPVVLSLAIPSFAQITGDLIINVTDRSGAIISGADISVKSAAQGSTRSLKSDAQGIARFSLLNIGDYEVRIEAPGFAVTNTRALINTGAVRELKAVLEVSATRQEVQVEESTIVIATTNSQM